jgi:hypothetical protein
MARFRVELEHTEWQQVLDLITQAQYRQVVQLVEKISGQLKAGPVADGQLKADINGPVQRQVAS